MSEKQTEVVVYIKAGQFLGTKDAILQLSGVDHVEIPQAQFKPAPADGMAEIDEHTDKWSTHQVFRCEQKHHDRLVIAESVRQAKAEVGRAFLELAATYTQGSYFQDHCMGMKAKLTEDK